jgi:uncharacterized protein
MPTDAISEAIAALPLVDHHVHAALRADVPTEQFEWLLTESDRLGPEDTSTFDSQVGFAVRRWCAPLLDLPAHCRPEDYLTRRTELGADEVNRRLLRASGIGRYLIDTGFRGEVLHDFDGMRTLSGGSVEEVVRLESIAEDLARDGVGAADFAGRFAADLTRQTEQAVGLKSVVAYRIGLDFDPQRPSDAEVRAAAGPWLAEVEHTGQARLVDPTLLRHVLWAGIDRGLPLQFHVGYGDPDLDLARCDPLLLTGFLKLTRPTRVPILLLHNYPFQRGAGYLAQVFPDVYFDIGLGVNYTGARSGALVRESLELAPFAKVLFSSDAWGLAELHYLGAHLWRRGMADALRSFVDADEWSTADAVRVATMIGVENAQRVYGPVRA